MELVRKQMSSAARSWNNRADARYLAKVDYSSELRSWVQCVILDAEEMKDLNRKGKFLSLLEDL